jgi:TIR domain
MPWVAISYRRTDSAMAGRISDQLKAHYGRDAVFIDIENIPFGIDFRDHIRSVLQRSDVLVALIGANWLGRNAAGNARIDEESDPVRVEIETALERKMPIIPVLIDGAKMPGSGELPASFGNFAYLNAAEASSGRFFGVHVEHLIAAIDRIAAPTPQAARDVPTIEPVRARKSMPQAALAAGMPSAPRWRVKVARYFLAPLVALLAAHYAIVNSLNLNVDYLRLFCILVPFAAGFALSWIDGGGAGPATIIALALALAGTAGMTISESLYSGDPMLPQSRFEWLDNFQFAATIALSLIVGHLGAQLLRSLMKRRLEKL